MSQPIITPAGIGVYGSFEQGASLGVIPGVAYMRKFGRNVEVDAGTHEDVIAGGGLYAGQPADATPETIEILCPDAADVSDGTGMRTVRIVGLRTPTATAYTSEDITLVGAAVDSALTWWRIVSVRGLTFGTGGANAGLITARSKTTTAEIFAVVQVGVGRSQVAVLTSPATTVTCIRDMQISIARAASGAGNAQFEMHVRASGSGGYTAVDNWEIVANSGGVLAYQRTPLILHAGDDFLVHVMSVSANTTICTANFDAFMFDNSDGRYDSA
jgi:hypothetical protein